MLFVNFIKKKNAKKFFYKERNCESIHCHSIYYMHAESMLLQLPVITKTKCFLSIFFFLRSHCGASFFKSKDMFRETNKMQSLFCEQISQIWSSSIF